MCSRAEVYKLDITRFWMNKDVTSFNITMKDTHRMAILNSFQEITKDFFGNVLTNSYAGIVLIQAILFPYKFCQVYVSFRIFHDNVPNFLIRTREVVKCLDYVFVFEQKEKGNFSRNFFRFDLLGIAVREIMLHKVDIIVICGMTLVTEEEMYIYTGKI